MNNALQVTAGSDNRVSGGSHVKMSEHLPLIPHLALWGKAYPLDVKGCSISSICILERFCPWGLERFSEWDARGGCAVKRCVREVLDAGRQLGMGWGLGLAEGACGRHGGAD